MREKLQRWIADTETQQSMEDFGIDARLGELDYLEGRSRDLYFSLVGELFRRIRASSGDRRAWATLGNALADVSSKLGGTNHAEALFFSSAAFYCGGYPASAVLTMRRTNETMWAEGVNRACFDLLNRQGEPRSDRVRSLFAAVRDGDMRFIERAAVEAEQEAKVALQIGPDEWIAHRLYATLIHQFQLVNLRAVLPDGVNNRWDQLVQSFLTRRQPIWEFFPSQIEAIDAGLLTTDDSYSLQMPTGAGKTALSEALLFDHLVDSPGSKAVLLVPFRALARELRYSVGRNLTKMGLQSRTVYGGTVPTIEEGEGIDNVRVIIATPEALIGLLGSHPELSSLISMVICDEGHLLASQTRGISLELLLARFRGQLPRPRIIFLSAIVPNVEEINSWLGGSDSTVVRSEYRPAVAEYAVLRPNGSGRTLTVGLELQELSTSLPAHTLPGFLRVTDFQFRNMETGRQNTYSFGSKKTQAIAMARKSLPLGTVAVFAAVKTGTQGVISLAEELIAQTEAGIPLPRPDSYIGDASVLNDAVGYLTQEFGNSWTGARALTAGAVLHHGDLPQETREVLEELLTDQHVRLVLCTSTLAEGVNLPIRTMVLYSVTRGSNSGRPVPMLARDIKNLVGRAGRAGSSTRGLVICVNPDQWDHVRPVAAGEPGEPIEGALIDLLRRLERAMATHNSELTNEDLESVPALLPLIDGIDSTLIELIHDELGSEEFIRIADSLVANTLAAQQADESQRSLLNGVFQLRATRLLEMKASGRLDWARETGGRPRLIDSVIESLYPNYDEWTTAESALDGSLLKVILTWALEQPGFAESTAEAYDKSGITDVELSLLQLVTAWIEGRTFAEISVITGLPMDKLLHIHSRVVLYDLTTLVEQAVALLHKFVQDTTDDALSSAVAALPDLLRKGVSNLAARELMALGMRHRRAAVDLGAAIEAATNLSFFSSPWSTAREMLEDEETWRHRLGSLVYRRSVQDVAIRWLG